MANSCKAIALLGGYPDKVSDAAFRYGLHVGVAFQLIDDLLGTGGNNTHDTHICIMSPSHAADFEGSAALLGKPAMNDVKQGLATGPVLFAAQQFPTLLPIIERKFESPGDVDTTLKYVAAADGLQATRRLAIRHGQMALSALDTLHPSPARTALAALVARVLSRNK
jgi:geranylgeranyl pyrophosphate synthase